MCYLLVCFVFNEQQFFNFLLSNDHISMTRTHSLKEKNKTQYLLRLNLHIRQTKHSWFIYKILVNTKKKQIVLDTDSKDEFYDCLKWRFLTWLVSNLSQYGWIETICDPRTFLCELPVKAYGTDPDLIRMNEMDLLIQNCQFFIFDEFFVHALAAIHCCFISISILFQSNKFNSLNCLYHS